MSSGAGDATRGHLLCGRERDTTGEGDSQQLDTYTIGQEWGVLFIEVSSFQGVLIRGVPAVQFIEVSSFQGVLIRGFLLSCLLRCPHFRES